LLSFLVGCVLSLVYYGGYVVSVLTVSLPALLKRSSNAGVGLDERYLGAKLLSGFWPQLVAHFATWPALLAPVGLVLAGMSAVGWAVKRDASRSARNNYAPRIVALVFLVAWAMTFLAFSAIDLRVNLLQRHMLFGLPLLALLAGYALSRLRLHVGGHTPLRHVSVLIGLLVVYLFVVGWNLWVERVLHYVLPPGSG
jgi:hypothetical protein